MADQTPVTDEIFPQHTTKSYSLVEVMHGEGPLVGKGPDDTVFAFPIVLLWEIVLLLGVTLFIFLFSLIKQAPLETIANPLVTTDPAKAPWYFMGFQELLVHLHPLVAVLMIPLAGVVLLLRLPRFHDGAATEGVWFLSSRGRITAALGAAAGAVATLAGILLDEYVLDMPGWMPGVPALLTAGLLPLLVYAALAWGLAVWLGRQRQATGEEVAQALCTALLGAFLVLTIVGAGFRGEGMALAWPWASGSGSTGPLP